MTDQQAPAPAADPLAYGPIEVADDPVMVIDGDYYDVLVLRAIAHMPTGQRVNGWTIAQETGLDVLDVRSITERLEGEGHLYRFMGLRVTQQALDTFGTALWVCETCGCVDEAACSRGCSWVAPNLCSAHGPDHTIEGRP